MLLDRAFLARHASYLADGIEERAFFMSSGEEACHAVLYLPEAPKELGFVVCHSYGAELLLLRRIERGIARMLGSLGHPVLAFWGRGFGDSTGSLTDATVERLLEDVEAAWARLAEEAGASSRGFVGCRLGGLIAALRARRGDVDRLLLVNPVLRGADYPRQSIRDMHIVRVASGSGPKPPTEELLEELERTGKADVLGYAFYRKFIESLAPVDLTESMGDFAGDALVIQASKRRRRPRKLESLRGRIEQAGGVCRIELVQEPPGMSLGVRSVVSGGMHQLKVDGTGPLLSELADRVLEWMRE